MSDGMNLEPWQWAEPVWRGYLDQVRAGKSLLHPEQSKRWPASARCAVALSFDADHETLSLRDKRLSPGRLSEGEYGARVGVPRILRLLDEHDIPASFFVPAVSALMRPAEAPNYQAHGHEVGVHGWIHERNSTLSAADEYDLVARALDVLESQLGSRPTGIRTPSWDFSPTSLRTIKSLGFEYDSSLMADDSPYELLENGDTTGVVEIPVSWIRDDVPYLSTDMASAARPYMAPRDLSQIWRDEFDGAYEAGEVFQLTMHPHVIGHRSRIVVLGQLLDYIRGHSDVWFTTHGALSKHLTTNLHS